MSRYRATTTVDEGLHATAAAPAVHTESQRRRKKAEPAPTSSGARRGRGGSGIIPAIYESISTDESFYPENPVSTSITMAEDGRLVITSEADNLAHLRANLNSTLRLIQACHASITASSGPAR
ncbi:MAG: KEOPS complex subunit Pcc1 [Thaumarchaeota archaeon]|nr:KEOPS complex subunit Pcc1 [Nitrososphaerota archaeon]MDE0265798.1 KEOPS complex subunit Pcc1 [Nitrososphaerota archaeon]